MLRREELGHVSVRWRHDATNSILRGQQDDRGSTTVTGGTTAQHNNDDDWHNDGRGSMATGDSTTATCGTMAATGGTTMRHTKGQHGGRLHDDCHWRHDDGKEQHGNGNGRHDDAARLRRRAA